MQDWKVFICYNNNSENYYYLSLSQSSEIIQSRYDFEIFCFFSLLNYSQIEPIISPREAMFTMI